ncbi:right-handed parallel beta-helix repeat-containing protein [Rubellicoccus peritrichatus]|uniref:Right-handed parallel beta-helix repeat-containing protein n=1 Tax=Rubellicoccus peritrichatus TaxID=3080537 RepID=A0AAQ3LDY3_9BACT|nr:right-handed parallel beta-helix repeat-containing protein [Puniceicoccus sp. CR14]WOO42832.1 right-handed parallel beta-helix repeat-containing protein [Puniceicoccus sp. CR14]
MFRVTARTNKQICTALIGFFIGAQGLEAFPITGIAEVVQSGSSNHSRDLRVSVSDSTTPGAWPIAHVTSLGDYVLDITDYSGSTAGVLITSVAENGRDNSLPPNVDETAGTFYATCASYITPDNEHCISVSKGGAGGEFNTNCAFGYFPFSDWLGAMTTNPSNGAAVVIHGSSSEISLGDELVDHRDGTFTVDLTDHLVNGKAASSNNGILLVNSGENEDNFALSRANANGTFTIFSHDNGDQGAAYEADSIAFVYIPQSMVGSQRLVAMGRIKSGTGFDVIGGSLSITHLGVGRWALSITGHSPETGTLLISAEGGDNWNVDNAVSYEWDADENHWEIQSRDLPAMGLQNGSTVLEDMFSFAFFETNTVSQTVTTSVDEDDAVATDGAGVSLREAIREARTGSRIEFDSSLNGATFPIATNIALDRSVEIDASMLPDGIICSYQDALFSTKPSFVSTGGVAIINNLTIQDGERIVGGAFSVGEEGHLILNDCVLRDNEASFGGGALYNAGFTILNRCEVYGNSSVRAGAIYQNNSVHSFVAQQTPYTLQIYDSYIKDNHAPGIGGAIYAALSATFIDGSTIANNTSGANGGAIFVESANLEIRNSTISGNRAAINGGAIYQGLPVLEFVTITDNEAVMGGGLYTDGGSTGIFTHCIIANNRASSSGPDMYRETAGAFIQLNGVNLFSDLSDTFLTASDTIIEADPRLGDFDYYGGLVPLYPIDNTSPAFDQGAQSSYDIYDQRGLPRSDTNVDLGAFEYQGYDDQEHFWETNWDHDAFPYGAEIAQQGDPFVADDGGPGRLRFENSVGGAGTPRMVIEIDPLLANVHWVLKRSDDMIEFDEVFRFDGTTGSASAVSFERIADVFYITDPDPLLPAFFYRFEAELVDLD